MGPEDERRQVSPHREMVESRHPFVQLGVASATVQAAAPRLLLACSRPGAGLGSVVVVADILLLVPVPPDGEATEGDQEGGKAPLRALAAGLILAELALDLVAAEHAALPSNSIRALCTNP